MKNCLVKRLNDAVNNDNNPYVNGIVINVFQESQSGTDRRIGFSVSGGTIVFEVLEGSVYFTDSTYTEHLPSKISFSTPGSIYLSNNSGKILIRNKYNLANLNFGDTINRFCSIDVNELCYTAEYASLDYFETVRIRTRLSGNLSELVLNKKLKKFDVSSNTILAGKIPSDIVLSDSTNFNDSTAGLDAATIGNSQISSLNARNNPNVVGNIGDCAALSIRGMFIEGAGIYGRVEDFYENMWGKGLRDEVTVQLRVSAGITYPLIFHETAITTTVLNGTIFNGVFSANGITVKDGNSDTTIATWDGSDWVYN